MKLEEEPGTGQRSQRQNLGTFSQKKQTEGVTDELYILFDILVILAIKNSTKKIDGT